MRKIASLGMGLAFVGLTTAAMANNPMIELTTLPTGTLDMFGDFSYGSGTDQFTFTLTGSGGNANAGALSFNFGPLSSLGTMSLALYSGTGTGGLLDASGTGTNFASFVNAGIGPGVYTLAVSGTQSGSYLGALDVVAAAPVPEPSEWMLLLSGLGGIVAVWNRRRPNAARLAWRKVAVTQ
jgi:PEP-CTERM motif-containing protein